MLHCSNGLIWYSARCWLLFWYARQSVLMEDDCSRVWRQFDGLWMRAHSVPLTAQDNALCSLLPLSHNLTQHNTPHWTASHNISVCNAALVLLLYNHFPPSFIFVQCNKTEGSQNSHQFVFEKNGVVRNEQIGSFCLFVSGTGKEWHGVCLKRHRES